MRGEAALRRARRFPFRCARELVQARHARRAASEAVQPVDTSALRSQCNGNRTAGIQRPELQVQCLQGTTERLPAIGAKARGRKRAKSLIPILQRPARGGRKTSSKPTISFYRKSEFSAALLFGGGKPVAVWRAIAPIASHERGPPLTSIEEFSAGAEAFSTTFALTEQRVPEAIYEAQ